MTAQPWSADLSREFFHVYQDAFSDRPGFRVAGEPQWRAAFATGDAFRPGLSLLLRSGRQPVAFTICEAVSEHVGRIRQMGICAGWRRRGLVIGSWH